jgi:hypothetical protein
VERKRRAGHGNRLKWKQTETDKMVDVKDKPFGFIARILN